MRDESQVAGMACPVCRTALMLSERQGVEIDYCPSCRGVWLDRGEIDKIIERSANEFAQPAPPPQQRGSGDDYRPDRGDTRYPQAKRKKSFFDELFD